MANKPKTSGLGRGLASLISEAASDTSATDGGVLTINVKKILRNEEQPRKQFDEESLKELAESVKEHGIIQPLIVVRDGDNYKIAAGERRYRAALMAGLNEVPVIVKDFTDEELMQVALIENLQREDLNAVEEANAYKALTDKFGMTQEELSKRIGKSRTAIANSLRILNLPGEVIKLIETKAITAGHARAVLSLENESERGDFARYIAENTLSVREAEKSAKSFSKNVAKPKKQKKANETETSRYAKNVEDELSLALGTKVKLKDGDGKGEVVIEYYSYDDLSRIIETITGKE